MSRVLASGLMLTLMAVGVAAQLPPDAVMLDKVKVSEQLKSHELDPVTLKTADPGLPTWEHNGVKYGSSEAGSQEIFMADPDKYIAAHDKQRWEYNFNQSMSIIWCPVTDEISPGGNTIWEELGLKWESCCQFCNDTKSAEDFPRALERLKVRAAKSYDLIGGAKYTEGASSPVEGAINLGGPPPAASDEADCEPTWLQGETLEATYAGGIAKIMEQRCTDCHRQGGAAPMAMITLGQVRKWKKNMKTHIELGTMPPWPAGNDPCFANGKNLTQKEKDLFLEFIAAGYPPGEGKYTPEKSWGEWSIGEPDHVFALPEYTVPETASDLAREFEIETSFDEDKWIVATEVVPTDVFFILQINAGPLGSYHMGASAREYPEGYGTLVKKGEKIKVRVFYMKEEGWEEFDTESKIAVKFASDSAPRKNVYVDRMANDDFTLAAGADSTTVNSSFTFEADGEIVSVNPVMRLRGKSVTVTAKFPDGREEKLLAIDHWDPVWNFRYEMLEPIKAPKGTVVTAAAVYDNSEMNAQNPDASVEVKASSGAELLEGWISYTLDGEMKSAENRFGLTDEQLMASTGTCAKCQAAAEAKSVATD